MSGNPAALRTGDDDGAAVPARVNASPDGPRPARVVTLPVRPRERTAALGTGAGPTPAQPARPVGEARGAAAVEARAAAPAVPAAVFIDLEDGFRKAATIEALRLVLATGARKLVAYDVGLVLERDAPAGLAGLTGGADAVWRVRAVSGTTSVDRQAPLPQAFEALVADLARHGGELIATPQAALLAPETAGAALAAQVATFPHLFWVPIHHPDGQLAGAFAVLRGTPLQADERTLLAALAGPFGHARAALAERRLSLGRRLLARLAQRRLGFAALALAVLVLAFPVRFSALAPAEVVGARPTLVTAPLDGIVREVLVEPGDRVAKGTPLLHLVDTRLRNDLEIARKNRAVAAARFQRAVQSAVANRRDGEDIAVARADLDVAEAELRLASELLERARVLAPRDGVVVYSARSNWVGKPVTTGERIMEVVDPGELELRVDLGVADAMALKPGGGVRLFLDGDPLGTVTAGISRIGYRPVAQADQQLVYRVFADFAVGQAPRLGARGTARIDGERVPLGFYLFRRPIAALRQKLGL